jgi:hypothetical protein
MYCDFAISNEASRDGNTVMMGLVDAATNRSWVYPMPGHTTAQVITKLEELLSQDIKGEDIDEFCCDNDACFTDEFKRWAHKKGWKIRMSATYKQHQPERGGRSIVGKT